MMNNPIGVSQMLKANPSDTNLKQKFTNLKVPQDKRNSGTNVGKELKTYNFPKVEVTRKETLAGSKVNEFPKKNPELRESIVKNREPKEKAATMMGYQNKWSGQRRDHKKTLENMAKMKFDNANEPQPIHYDSKLGININNDVGDTIKFTNMIQKPALLSSPAPVTMSYNDCHLINVLHTKVLAHTNGFFANSLPGWYEKTFGKTLPTNWLDLLKYSEKFTVEQLENKVVVYAMEGEIGKSSGQTKGAHIIESEAYESRVKQYGGP